jgi:hypothetical protein
MTMRREDSGRQIINRKLGESLSVWKAREDGEDN